MGITGKVAIVTGASSGIGAELAVELARRGAKVGLTARRLELLDAVAGRIREVGGTAAVAAADASDREATHSAIESLAAELGPVDILVANAGVGLSESAVTFTSDRLETMIRVNVLGAAHAFESVLPSMVERRQGHLVGISSLAAYRGLPGSAGYCATKAALTALLEAFRPELKPRGIHVSSVHPGFVTTPMIAGASHPRPFEMSAERAARIIANGIERRRARIDFPLPMVLLLKLVRAMPNGLFDRLGRGLADKR